MSTESGEQQRDLHTTGNKTKHDKVSVAEAQQALLSIKLEPCAKAVPVTSLRQARVLAQDVIALKHIPLLATSIMDGYAVKSSDPIRVCKQVGASWPGKPFNDALPRSLENGMCIQISTGSLVPSCCDCVIKVEDTTKTEDGLISFDSSIVRKPGLNIRMPGSDQVIGDLLLPRGAVVGPAELGTLLSSGHRAVLIYRKPKICVMSTGDELIDMNEEAVDLDGRIYDTNRPQLMALFEKNHFKAIDAGIARDSDVCLVEGLRTAFRFADVIVTSGSASMGEKDMLKDLLVKEFGFKLHFGKVLMKPGLPTSFASGTLDGDEKYVFILPGNPVSAYVCALLFVVPFMRRLAGKKDYKHTEIEVKLTHDITLDARPEYRRATAIFHNNNTGIISASCISGSQISSRIASLSMSNLLLQLPAKTSDRPIVKEGEIVTALVISDL